MIDIYLTIGVVGMFLILLAFLMEQLNKWKNSYLSYDLVNFVGSFFMVIYAYAIRGWPFLILNGIWMIFSLKDSIQDKIKKRN